MQGTIDVLTGEQRRQQRTLSERRAKSLTLLVWVAEKSSVWRVRGMLATMAFSVAEKPCTGEGGLGKGPVWMGGG